jgi:hypothetical protein
VCSAAYECRGSLASRFARSQEAARRCPSGNKPPRGATVPAVALAASPRAADGDTAPHPGGAVAEEWSIGDVSVPPHVQERIELLRRIVRTAKSISKWMAMVVLSQGVWALGWQYRVLSVYWIGILWNIVSEAFSLQALLQFLESRCALWASAARGTRGTNAHTPQHAYVRVPNSPAPSRVQCSILRAANSSRAAPVACNRACAELSLGKPCAKLHLRCPPANHQHLPRGTDNVRCHRDW